MVSKMKKNPRYEQLMALAADGDDAATGDLFLEFGQMTSECAEETEHATNVVSKNF